MKSKSVLAWHFVGATLRDGRLVPADGVKLKFDGEPRLCEQGLHASRHPFDALRYAPGNILCRVRCGGIIVESDDKLVCTERTIIARADVAEALRYFARQQALSVIHLYPGEPADCVLDFLMGDDSARAAASAAAYDADAADAADAARAAAAYAAASAAAYDADAADAAYAAASAAAYDADAAAAAYAAAAYAAYAAAAYAAYAVDADAADAADADAAREDWAQMVAEAFRGIK